MTPTRKQTDAARAIFSASNSEIRDSTGDGVVVELASVMFRVSRVIEFVFSFSCDTIDPVIRLTTATVPNQISTYY